MKRVFIFMAVLLSWSLSTTAQVQFIEATWSKAGKLAKKDQKFVFVDAYTDWCGWCKVMDKKTFSETEVGEYVNNHFVSIKIEMEKEEMGRKIAMKYGINSYPTFLIFDANERLVGKLVGFQSPEAFLKNLEEAIKPENQLKQPGYSADFDQNYPEMYALTFAAKDNRKLPDSTTLVNYFKQEFDLSNEVNWRVVNRFSYAIDYPQMMTLLEQKDAIIQNFGKDEYYGFIDRFSGGRLQSAIKNRDRREMNRLLTFMTARVEDPLNTLPYYSLAFSSQIEDWGNLVSTIENMRLQEMDLKLSFYNDYAWKIYEKCSDTSLVAKALSWMTPLIDEEAEWMYIDTYAALLYKSGEYDQAEKWARLAIESGKATGENVTETETLLSKILEEREAVK